MLKLALLFVLLADIVGALGLADLVPHDIASTSFFTLLVLFVLALLGARLGGKSR